MGRSQCRRVSDFTNRDQRKSCYWRCLAPRRWRMKVAEARGAAAPMSVFSVAGAVAASIPSARPAPFFSPRSPAAPRPSTPPGEPAAAASGSSAAAGYEWSYGPLCGRPWRSKVFIWPATSSVRRLVNPVARLRSTRFDDTFPTAPRRYSGECGCRLSDAVSRHHALYRRRDGGRQRLRHRRHSARSTRRRPASTTSIPSSNSSSWGFAAQAKAGARLALGDSGAYLFGEYRYLYVGSTDTFLAPPWTPTMLSTSPWTASFGGTSHHLAAGGIGFNF